MTFDEINDRINLLEEKRITKKEYFSPYMAFSEKVNEASGNDNPYYYPGLFGVNAAVGTARDAKDFIKEAETLPSLAGGIVVGTLGVPAMFAGGLAVDALTSAALVVAEAGAAAVQLSQMAYAATKNAVLNNEINRLENLKTISPDLMKDRSLSGTKELFDERAKREKELYKESIQYNKTHQEMQKNKSPETQKTENLKPADELSL